MEIELREIEGDLWTDVDEVVLYDPLHDDAQAMAMVKKFRIKCAPIINRNQKTWWACYEANYTNVESENLNRAICECVAAL